MKTCRLSLVLLFTCLFISTIYGSSITFNASVSVIKTALTETLTLRCDVNGLSLNGAVVGRRDKDHSSGDIQFLTSLVVTRNNGEHVASVTPFGSHAMVDPSNLQVTGDITGNTDRYIELTWEYPTEQQAGTYICEANGIGGQGHNIVLTQRVEIASQTPTVVDLVNYVRDQKLEIKDLQASKVDLKSEIATLHSHIATLTSTDTSLQSHIANLTTTLTSTDTTLQSHIANLTTTLTSADTTLQSQISNLTSIDTVLQNNILNNSQMIGSILNSPNHVQNGSFICDNSQNWYYTKTVSVSFKNAYEKVPFVYLGVSRLAEHSGSGARLSYQLDLVDVTTLGFTVKCVSDIQLGIYKLTVSWFSIPE